MGKPVPDLMASLERSLGMRGCQWPECCGDPDEDDFCGGCNRAAFEAHLGQEGTAHGSDASLTGPPPSDQDQSYRPGATASSPNRNDR